MATDDPPTDFSKAPRHESSYRRYVLDGGHVGDFLRNVIENDLVGAVQHADGTNEGLLAEHVTFIFNELPASCWGSEEAYRSWVDQGGWNGLQDEEA